MADQEDAQGLGFETRAIHVGQEPDPTTGAVVTPVTLSTTFAQRAVGEHQGYEYARSGNPTRSALEACVASLERAAHGLAFASGLAAEDNILRLLEPGAGILLGNDAYGGTYRLISKVFGPAGYRWHTVDLTNLDALRRGWPDGTRMVWVETPTNPLLSCIDIEAVAAMTHQRGALAGRRQHLRHALPAAAARPRRRCRRPLGHEVPGRPLRRDRRLHRPRRR